MSNLIQTKKDSDTNDLPKSLSIAYEHISHLIMLVDAIKACYEAGLHEKVHEGFAVYSDYRKKVTSCT